MLVQPNTKGASVILIFNEVFKFLQKKHSIFDFEFKRQINSTAGYRTVILNGIVPRHDTLNYSDWKKKKKCFPDFSAGLQVLTDYRRKFT